jgi:TonB family protein
MANLGPPPDQRKTIMIPIKYVDGARMVSMLRMFVPREHHNTEIQYSHALHKLLIRAQSDVLQILKQAAEQMDTPQTQFGVWIHFVRSLNDTDNTTKIAPPELLAALQRTFPDQKRFALLKSRYIHAINHEQARSKILNSADVSAPSLELTLRQAPTPNAPVMVDFKIMHHESFPAKTDKGTNTSFISSIHISTKLMIRPGIWVLVGHIPWRESNQKNDKALVLLKIEQLNLLQQPDKPKIKSIIPLKTTAPIVIPQKTLTKDNIRSVINAQRSAIRACYEKVLLREPSLEGRVVVSFTIHPNGAVTEAKISSNTLKQAQVEECLLQIISKMQFQPIERGGIVRVNYPFVFNTTKSPPKDQ